MRRAGKVSPLLLVALVGIVAVVVFLFFGKEGPGPAASRFMDALARGDVNALTQTSFANGKSQDELRKEWEFTTKVPGQHYLFKWRIVAVTQSKDDQAAVRMMVERNYGPGSYEDPYELPLLKVDGKWKVDASGISREMYPGLPRTGSGIFSSTK